MTFAALTLVVLALMSAQLACTANDTLFIRLTETPTPTITPTPLALETRLKVGDSGVIVGVSEFNTIGLPPLPGPFRPGVSGGATCFPNSRVKVLDVSLNTQDSDDETIYYQVQCTGKGWIPEYQLSRFGKFDEAVVRTKDGTDAPLYSSADATTSPSDSCANDTRVQVLSLTANPFVPTDQNIYLQVSCGTASGYILESSLAPAS